MSSLRNIFLFFIFIGLMIGCTEKKPEKIDNPHSNLTSTESRVLSKETLMIFKSIENDNIEYLKKKLAKKEIDFGVMNKSGDSLLVFAAGRNKKAAVQLLLNAGAPVNAYGGQGDSALIRAVSEDRRDVVKILLDAKASVNVRGSKAYLGASPLFLASSIGSIEIVDMLVSSGADVNLANLQGVTPLMDAAYGSLAMVKLLLKHGAKPGLRDENGHTALKIARQEGQSEIFKILKLAQKKNKKTGKQ